MKNLLISSLTLFLTACAGTYSLPQGLTEITPSSPLACRFEKQTTSEQNSQRSNWYFWREATRTESRDQLSNQGEIWQRNKAGQLFYTRLFYNERVALEFVPGDMAATQAAPSWSQLTAIIDPKTLGKELVLVAKDNANGVSIEQYSGTLNAVATEVDWLPSMQLPARLLKKLADGTVTLTLSECAKASNFAAKPISKAELDNFRHLDYTDLGDMEDDPLVRHLEQLMGGHHHDGH